MSQKRDNQISKILYKTVKDKNSVFWKKIMDAVKAEMKIKDWLEVRNILQGFIDNNIIERVPDIFNERYIRIGVWH